MTVPDSVVRSRVTEPPWSWTILVTMARPRPVPLGLPELTKGSKTVVRIDEGMPQPWSMMRTSNVSLRF